MKKQENKDTIKSNGKDIAREKSIQKEEADEVLI